MLTFTERGFSVLRSASVVFIALWPQQVWSKRRGARRVPLSSRHGSLQLSTTVLGCSRYEGAGLLCTQQILTEHVPHLGLFSAGTW